MARGLAPCGSHAAYVRHRRRGEDPCAACVDEHRLYMQRWRQKAAALSAAQIPHGENGFRNYGCRCPICTDANKRRCAQYRTNRAERKTGA